MQDQNLDINLVVQSFQEKVTQLMTENIIKDVTIKQLNLRIKELENMSVKQKQEKKTDE